MHYQPTHFLKAIKNSLNQDFLHMRNLKENYFKCHAWIFIFCLISLNHLYYWNYSNAQFNWFKKSFLFYLKNFMCSKYHLVFFFSWLKHLSNPIQKYNLTIFSFVFYLIFKFLSIFRLKLKASQYFFKLKMDWLHHLKYHSVSFYLFLEE